MSKLFSTFFVSLSLALTFLTAGCGRDDIKVYRVSKEEPAAPRPATAPMSDESRPSGRTAADSALPPKISWTLPSGWQEAGAGQMSRASFTIAGENGASAQVTITPLRGLSGQEVPIVNMWRQQVGQPELTPEEAQQQLKPVEIGDQSGKMFDVTGKSDTGAAMRIVTAMNHVAGTSWFYKLSGDDALVEAQKPTFITFLKSIKLIEAPAPSAALPEMGGPPVESAPDTSFAWKVPAGWTAVSPGQLQIAKFSVPAKDAAKADVMVSVFPNSTGGTLANVNRWRGQIGLPPIGEAELATLVTPLDPASPDTLLVDMTGPQKQLIGAIVPREGQWYFYKLLGDPAAVAPQKDAFVAFVKSKP